jgi:hypothetical protein
MPLADESVDGGVSLNVFIEIRAVEWRAKATFLSLRRRWTGKVTRVGLPMVGSGGKL